MLDQRRVPHCDFPAVCVVPESPPPPTEAGARGLAVVNVIMHPRCALASRAHLMCAVPQAADRWRCYHCGQLIGAVPTP